MADSGTLSASQQATINNVLDGSLRQELVDLRSSINQSDEKLIDAQLTINKMPLGAEKDQKAKLLAAAKASNLAARQQLNVAVANHNKLAGWLSTATGSQVQLAGLGFLPVAVEVIIAVAGGLYALSLVIDAIAKSIAASHGKDIETKGYISQLGDFATASSGLFKTIAIAGGVGVALWLVYKYTQTRKGGA
jgi:hypothetical protein